MEKYHDWKGGWGRPLYCKSEKLKKRIQKANYNKLEAQAFKVVTTKLRLKWATNHCSIL